MKHSLLSLALAVAISAGATVYAVSTGKPAPRPTIASDDPVPPVFTCPPVCGR